MTTLKEMEKPFWENSLCIDHAICHDVAGSQIMIMLNIIRSHLDRNLLGLRTCPITKLRKHVGQIWALFLGILAVLLLL